MTQGLNVSFRASPAFKKALHSKAKTQGRSVSNYIKQVLGEDIKKSE